MKFRRFAICLLVFFAAASAASAQAVRNLDTVRRISTARFEIYYPQSLCEEAGRLSGFADRTLAELESFFGVPEERRKIPILLSDTSMDLNGYSTTFPSNRIVIFCAEPDIALGLASLDDPLYLVFLHELTHEVTLNIRSPLWKLLKAILGDFVAPSGWMMPASLVEGQAVSIESGLSSSLDVSAAQKAGRLNDPAALEPVFDEKRAKLARSLWDVSGAMDFPGSGNLPYLYGALFVRYVGERFGQEALVQLWQEAGKGNVLLGFENSLLAEGIVKKVTGVTADQLWADFQDWLGEVASEALSRGDRESETASSASNSNQTLRSGSVPISSRRIGAFSAGNNAIFYLDKEKQAVFRQDFDGESFSHPRKLFNADGYVRQMTLSDDGKTLLADWRAYDSNQIPGPAQYRFDLEKGILIQDKARNDAQAPAEIASRALLQYLCPVSSSGQTIVYGLLRVGTVVYPARVFDDGRIEIWKGMPGAVRSISIRRNREPATSEKNSESIDIVLGLVGDDLISRPMLLEEDEGVWSAWEVDCALPSGGAHSPVLLSEDRLAFSSPGLNGINTLYWSEFSKTRNVPGGWEPYAKETTAAQQDPGNTLQASVQARRFPEVFRTSRLPYADADSAGISFQAMDLTERLSWSANLGLNISAKVPEASLAIALSTLKGRTVLAVQDGASSGPGSSATRISSILFEYDRHRSLMPVWKSLDFSVDARYAGLRTNYTADSFFNLNPDYVAVSFGIKAQYSTMHSSSFAPFDQNGVLMMAALDLEDTSVSTASLAFTLQSSAALASAGIQADVYLSGSITSDELRFAPSGRSYTVSGSTWISGRPAEYPAFQEYAAIEGKQFYAFSELSVRLFSAGFFNKEGQSAVIKMPLSPSVLARRAGMVAGSRFALLFDNLASQFLSSLFLRAELDFSVLAGLAAQNHLVAGCELALPLAPSLAGRTFLVSFSLKNGW
ncbi:MAG: hypothetical protein LWX00_07625 [Spirochaetia bacterium]|nr:hypothetical protein [Spirochaetia bacterium]